jgi:MFS transporter, DHA2 family, multidrug resistance protein
MDQAVTEKRAGLQEWAGLAVLALPCLLVSMDTHVLNLAIPRLTADLRPTTAELLWIVDSYAFLVAGCLMTAGALGDRLGRRRLLLIGAAGFGLASLLAAFATSPAMLIAARVLLGVAGSTLMPSTLSLIRVMFHDARQRRTAFGVWTASFSLGGLIAPVVAGLLLERFWWGSVFLVAVPPMALLLAFGPRLRPEYRAPGAARIDAVSAALSIAGVLSVVYGVKRVAQSGLDPRAGLPIAAGLLLIAVFVRRQQREDPWIDLGMFRRRTFSVPLAANALCFFVLYGTSFFFAQYLQLVLGLSALEAGLWSIPGTLGYLLGSALAPVGANRLRPVWMLSLSLAVTAAGFGLLTQLDAQSGLPVLVTGAIVFSIGLAPVYVLATEMTVASVPAERSGAASGILETCTELGGAFGIAFLGSLGGAVYRDTMNTDGPPALGAELGHAGGEAFTLAFRTVEVVGAGAIGVAAVATALLLKRRREPARPQQHHEQENRPVEAGADHGQVEREAERARQRGQHVGQQVAVEHREGDRAGHDPRDRAGAAHHDHREDEDREGELELDRVDDAQV